MIRAAMFFSALIFLAGGATGCCMKDKEALRLLPDEGTLAFDDLLARVRAQASTALEAFYIDDWAELEDVAKALEQAARYLPKTTQQPATLKDLPKTAAQLRREATQLSEAARAKSVDATNTALQRITLQVRLLQAKQ